MAGSKNTTRISICFMFLTFDKMICTNGELLLGSDEETYNPDHIKYMKNIQRSLICSQDESKCAASSQMCWGYEEDCSKDYMFQYPLCESLQERHRWMGMDRYTEHYWTQGGFGYVKRKIDSINVLCGSEGNEGKESGGSFKCSDKWEYCEADNLYIDFRQVELTTGEKYREDLHTGANKIGGFCRVNKELIEKPVLYNNELLSWNAELKSFSGLESNPFQTNDCDEIINKTTIFMKLDSGVNMYHHFCDFVNLYASQHILGHFSTDVYIVNWDTSRHSFYGDMFAETWDAFTQYPIQRLQRFVGKRICFKKAVFSLLPRMMYGLYYNTPLVDHCYGGGLLRAFSEHLLHRLGVFQNHYEDDVIRVTLLKRSTQYRNILNEEELVDAIKRIPGLNVSVVDYKYDNPPFLEQLKITHNSDIFIGIHGAGLTHLIFQPNWGAVFELYNTKDVHCYKDLARLRGIAYFTWENEELLKKEGELITPQHPNGHPKFTNYTFDEGEFKRILNRAIEEVKVRRPTSGG